MEHRTYMSSSSRDSSRMTRIQEDLSISRHHGDNLQTGGDLPMIRRAIGRSPHVCVVGAGVAGLRCAEVLLQYGVKVTVLEGRDRIGGRLCQSSALGHMVDLGPNWIHGTDSNPILDLAMETRTKTMTWDGRQAVFDYSGEQMSEKEAAENSELVWTIIEEAMKYSNENSTNIPAEKSLYEYFEERVEILFPVLQGSERSARKRQKTILDMAEMWGAFVGSPIQTQSLKFFWLEEIIDGENLFVAGTYSNILGRIAEPALRGADIRYQKVVNSIASSVNAGDPVVTVKFEEESIEFDEVVMTAPLGWLKRNKNAFTPCLPSRLEQGIDSIGYGHLDKAYISFPLAFWNESTSHSKSSASSKPDTTANSASIIQGPSLPTNNPNHWPGFTHWTSPRYASDTNPSHWNQECVNLAALPAETAHPTLLFYTFGPTSIYLASQLSKYPSTSDPAAQIFLSDFFAPYYTRLPNYSPSDPAHQPTAILATAWANDELAGYGSYANFQVGLKYGDEDIEVMRRGLPERGLWLAGEHTAPFVALGTVTGAYWAGEGVAERIARVYGLEKKDEKESAGRYEANGAGKIASRFT